eukprot:SM000839S23187  [mRNA]  locus=s839:123:959:+ [translate_table: standard]
MQLNETALSLLLDAVRAGGHRGGGGGGDGAFLAVLYHAERCPFSRDALPAFHALAALFPAVGHVAIEESRLRPSVLWRFGVHSFPTLYMQNRTGRFKYRGGRSLEDLARFYTAITGLEPAEVGAERRTGSLRSLVDELAVAAPGAADERHVPCPYPWAFQPEKWLGTGDTYLLLSSIFVAIRLLWMVVPPAVARLRAMVRHRT